MLFNSFEFLLFFPTVAFIYFLLPHRFRWFHLLLSSCVFYMAFIPVYIFILIFTIIVDYIAGIYIERSTGKRRKLFLICSIIANILILAVFKYFNFFTDNFNALLSLFNIHKNHLPFLDIILPVGLSFHTFQAMSYTIEVYRGNQKAEKHFGIYALYVMFFPQLVAGPIERPQNLLHQFRTQHYFDYPRVVNGMRLMLWGFFKKIVIADRLSIFVSEVYDQPTQYQGISLVLATVFFAFQIYCDFSGYSDIALGTAEVLGFKLMKNFNRPYFSKSISEFWSRWHISLSTWFRDYLYISLGGNRVSVPRWYFNLFFVFLVSGFWHGANWTFIAWGALHGFYLVFAIISQKRRLNINQSIGIMKNGFVLKIVQIITTFILVDFAWVFFRAKNIKDAIYIITHLLSNIPQQLISAARNENFSRHRIIYLNQTTYEFFIAIAAILFMESIHYFQRNLELRVYFSKKSSFFRWVTYALIIYSIILFGEFSNNSFIYFQF